MALFRFPNASIAVAADQKVAVRAEDGRFYTVTVQDILDLVSSGDYPSITDDGTDVSVDANLAITGTLTIGDLPTVDPANAGQLWLDTGTLAVSAG